MQRRWAALSVEMPRVGEFDVDGLALNGEAMNIKRNGSQASVKGSSEYFTGNVRIDPLFQAPGPGQFGGASVSFEPGARSFNPYSSTLRSIAARIRSLTESDQGSLDRFIQRAVGSRPRAVINGHCPFVRVRATGSASRVSRGM